MKVNQIKMQTSDTYDRYNIESTKPDKARKEREECDVQWNSSTYRPLTPTAAKCIKWDDFY